MTLQKQIQSVQSLVDELGADFQRMGIELFDLGKLIDRTGGKRKIKLMAQENELKARCNAVRERREALVDVIESLENYQQIAAAFSVLISVANS